MTRRLLRPLELDDVDELTALIVASREHLTPFEPARHESWFTVAGQRAVVRAALEEQEAGRMLARVSVDDDGAITGRFNLNSIVRGAAQTGHLGYWVGATHIGRGIATRAVGEMCAEAFGDLGLHSVQAGTLVDNLASQKVLERNGFERIGLAPRHISINGRWQDHILFQRLAPEGG
ncbi:GNAT family N-acetyltransferase [Actinomycetota bacterium]